jgi:hypothetical protein
MSPEPRPHREERDERAADHRGDADRRRAQPPRGRLDEHDHDAQGTEQAVDEPRADRDPDDGADRGEAEDQGASRRRIALEIVVRAQRQEDAERPPQHGRGFVAHDLAVRDQRREQRRDRRTEDADAQAVQALADRHEQRAAERHPDRRQHARGTEAICELGADAVEQLHHRRMLVVPRPRGLRELEGEEVRDVVAARGPVDVLVPGLAEAAEIEPADDHGDREHGAHREPRAARYAREAAASDHQDRRDEREQE